VIGTLRGLDIDFGGYGYRGHAKGI
jgi:hypothetical protein